MEDMTAYSIEFGNWTPVVTQRDPCEEFTNDFSDFPYPFNVTYPSRAEIAIKVGLYLPLILLALLGNSLVIIVIARDRKMRSTTNYLILNLAISDLLITFFCTWVNLVRDLHHDRWVLGAFFCKFNSFCQVLVLVSSVLTLVCIACDRFFGIVYTMEAHVSERRVSLFIIIIWTCALCSALPLLLYRRQVTQLWADFEEVWCAEDWPTTCDPASGIRSPQGFAPRTVYWLIIGGVLFFLPFIVMSLIYSIIAWKLWQRRTPGESLPACDLLNERIKRRVVLMAVVMVVSFGICWAPVLISILYKELKDPQVTLPRWYDIFHFIAVYLAYSNSAINPLVYAIFYQKFKKGIMEMCPCFRTRGRGAEAASLTGRESVNRATVRKDNPQYQLVSKGNCAGSRCNPMTTDSIVVSSL